MHAIHFLSDLIRSKIKGGFADSDAILTLHRREIKKIIIKDISNYSYEMTLRHFFFLGGENK